MALPWAALPWANTPERIIAKAQPLLEPGEVVAHVVRAQEGPSKWFAMVVALAVALSIGFLLPPIIGLPLFWLAYTGFYKRRIFLATDQALVVVAGNGLRWSPTKVLDRLDVETRIGPLKGLWLEARLGGHRYYVVPRSATAVAEADADVEQA